MESIVALLVALGLVLLMKRGPFRMRSGLRRKKPPVNPGDSIYEDLRNRALKTTAQTLGIEVTDDASVFGVVIDWNVGSGVATIVAYVNGDASLYFSGGGAVLGAGMHEAVRSAAIRLVAVANEQFEHAIPRQMNVIADKDEVVFNLLTGRGIFLAKESKKQIQRQISAWTDTFAAMNDLIEEIRRVQPSESQ